MRNPWGRGVEWKGDWSDLSHLWTPELKKQLGWANQNDGLFFIGLTDYLTHYRATSVCFAEANNLHSHKSFNMEARKTLFLSFTMQNKINLS